MSYIPMQQGIIYGPIRSKRLGRSLGVNLSSSAKKTCIFDCVYCHYGPTAQSFGDFPPADAVIEAVEKRLRQDREFDYITLAGNGEPTIHPEFETILHAIVRLRDALSEEKPIALLTNSATIAATDIGELVQLADKPMFKLDAADQPTFLQLNCPRYRARISEIIESLALLDAPIIQTLLIQGDITNVAGEPWNALLAAFRQIEPAEVQIYTIDSPIPETSVEPVTMEILQERAAELKEVYGINATLFT